MCRYAQSCAFISVIELPRIPAYCPKGLVEIEQNVRNIAAHNIVSATPEWVKEQAGRSVEDILWLLKYICEQVKINTRKENWDSYDYMNKRIIEELDR